MKYTILNLLLIIGISINAQISIGFSDYPVIGDIHKYDTTNIGGLTVGATGANAVWDFSSLNTNYNFERKFLSPNASTNSSQFPGANMLIQDAEAETFLIVDSNKVEMIGVVQDLTSLGLGLGITAIPFINTLTSIYFPTDYNNTFKDTFSYDITIAGGLTASTTAIVTSSIDAYGKLITPTDTIDCLREYVINVSTTSSLIGSNTITQYSYTWVALGHGSGIMEVTTNSSGNINTIKLKDVTSTLTNIKKQSQKNLSIRTDINNSFAVIEWKSNSDVQMSVYDMGGRCVKSIKPKNNYHILDLNEFKSGSYIVSIYGGNKTLSKQLIVK